MIAANIFNQQHHIAIQKIYGIVTIGMSWRFLCLEGIHPIIDITEYSIQTPLIIFGILHKW